MNLQLNEKQLNEFHNNLEIVEVVINSNYPYSFLKMHALDREDMQQYGYIGLIKGIKKYHEQERISYRNYLIQQVRDELRDGFREISLRKHNKNNLDAVDMRSIEGASVGVKTEIENRSSGDMGADIIMWEELKELDERLPSIIKELLEDRSKVEVSKRLNISRPTINKILNTHREEIEDLILSM